MKKSNSIIKIATVTLFSIMIIGFVALKSGCITVNSPEAAEKESLSNEEGINLPIAINKKTPTDTVAIQGSNDFAIVDKSMISSSKSMMIMEAEEIIALLSADSVPKDFKPTSEDTISKEGYEAYLKIRTPEKEKLDVIIPSSKSAPVFDD